LTYSINSQYMNVTDRQTGLLWQYVRAMHYGASRGNKKTNDKNELITFTTWHLICFYSLKKGVGSTVGAYSHSKMWQVHV